jgi:Gas vesicle synthesis protein GvpL/GvpF
MKLYAYCLTEAIDSLLAPASGINGAAVRLLKVGDFSLLVSDFTGDTVPVNRDNALAHAAVVRSVLDRTTPLPFRFGTLVTEQQLAGYVTSRRAALQGKLELVRGCVEMSVKIIWDREWGEEPPTEAGAKEKPGTAFLVEKRRELLGSEARVEEAKKIARWLEDRLGDAVRKVNFDTISTGKLLVSGACLLERAQVDRYRLVLKTVKLERPELHFLASGPWPPYSFANIDLEVKTQFGVS